MTAGELVGDTTRKLMLAQYIRPMVHDVLNNWTRYRWSIHGFGMLRAYLSKELRLHVWNSKFRVPGVTMIHDHPWNFESVVVSGRVVNTRYTVRPCTHSPDDVEWMRLRRPFIKAKIVCGPKGGNDPSDLKASGERVWLLPVEPETYDVGSSYSQEASEVHHTSFDDGTVTLVSRAFMPDEKHAHVFFKEDEEWVSAEPRDAELDEVSAIVDRALFSF